ncbi:hypothetical protein [Lacrimispora sp.]|uniref:hypothetical protein n=1 Tax=Lacrimispora sp. TaxID=2719234 RepID=UPI0028B01034|nr:hypothetical protein [Lacrimispora sp.]
MDIREKFENPGCEERGTPFWAWNCAVDPETMVQQIPYFKEMGMGGFLIHSRTGLDTPYLGELFMETVRACVEKAEQEGLSVHLYDEDRWPSGFAGGYVTKKPEYRARCLVFSKWPSGGMPGEISYRRNGRLDIRPHGNGRLLCCFHIELEEGYLKECRAVDGWAEGDDIWYLHEEVMEPDPWFNNQTYMDTINPEAVKAFLESTYEAYKEALGDKFGTAVPSIFTDEPQFIHKHFFHEDDGVKWMVLPYTETLEVKFRETYHTCFLKRIPELAWDKRDQQDFTVRYGYHRLLLEQFAATYCDALGEWCGRNGISLMGHMKGEGTLALQAGSLGEAMRNYRNFQIPGMDILCDKREYSTAKQVQSAARQMGRNQAAGEMYGVTGWDFDFRGHKLQGDWQAALGILHRVPHLAWASMEGEAKRDFPASIFYQSPWYREYALLETYFARISTVMKMGKPIVRLGVLHPIESFWLFYGAEKGASAELDKMEDEFQNVIRWLLFGNIDFDFISESLLEVQESGGGDGCLRVGAMRYEAILVPGLAELRGHTVAVLEKFRESGGRLIFAGRIPEYVDGRKDGRVGRLAGKALRIPLKRTAVLNALEEVRDVEITDGDGRENDRYIYQIRETKEERFLFLANGLPPGEWSGGGALPVHIFVKGRYLVERWNPLDGSVENLDTDCKERKGIVGTHILCLMHEHDSLLFRLKPASDRACADPGAVWQKNDFRADDPPGIHEELIPDLISVSLHEPNVLLMDQAEFRMDFGEIEEREEVLRLENVLRSRLGFPLKGESFAQPWTRQEKEPVRHWVELIYSVYSETSRPEITLAVEKPGEKELWWNDEEIKQVDKGCYVDNAIRKIPLGGLKSGLNRLLIRMPFTGKSDLEGCYLLGDFGVRLDGACAVLTDRANKAAFGDITKQGMPFYGGNLEYHLEVTGDGSCYILELSDFRAPLLSVEVDGKKAGVIAFAPYRLRLGELSGKHEISIISYGNRHNTFGALHNCKKGEKWFGPSAWRTEGDEFTYKYMVREAGVLRAPVLRRVPQTRN